MGRAAISVFVIGASITLGAYSPTLAVERLQIKPGVTVASLTEDEDACREAAKSAQFVTPPKQGLSPNGIVKDAVLKSIANSQARKNAAGACMAARGYKPARLSSADAKAYANLADSRRGEWLAAFFGSDRLAAALTPPVRSVPPLPTGMADPWNLGPVRITPGTVKVAEGPYRTPGQVVLTAEGKFLGIAKLKTDVRLPGGKIILKSGQVFYQAVGHKMLEGTSMTAWCALSELDERRGSQKSICLINLDDGYGYFLNAAWGGGFAVSSLLPELYSARISRMEKILDPIELIDFQASPAATVEFTVPTYSNLGGFPSLMAVVHRDGRTFELPDFSYFISNESGFSRIGRSLYVYSRKSDKIGSYIQIDDVYPDILPAEPEDYYP